MGYVIISQGPYGSFIFVKLDFMSFRDVQIPFPTGRVLGVWSVFPDSPDPQCPFAESGKK